MSHDDGLDGYRIQHLASGRDDGIVGSAVVYPVVSRIGRCVEGSLKPGIFMLTDNDLLEYILLVGLAIISVYLGDEGEPAPDLGILCQWRV